MRRLPKLLVVLSACIVVANGQLLAQERLAANPPSSESKTAERLSLGDSYLKQERFQEALNTFNDLLMENQNYIPAMLGRVRSLVGLQDLPKAQKWANKAASQAPDDPEVWRLLAELYLHHRYLDAPQAQQALEKLLTLVPDDRQAHLLLAKALNYQKKTVRAIEVYESWLKRQTADWPVQIKLAESYYAIRKLSQAEELLKQVLVAEPQNIGAQKLLSQVHGRKIYQYWLPVIGVALIFLAYFGFRRIKRGKLIIKDE